MGSFSGARLGNHAHRLLPGVKAAQLVLQIADVDGHSRTSDALDRPLFIGIGSPSSLGRSGGQVVGGGARFFFLILCNAHLIHLVVMNFVDNEAFAVANNDFGVWVRPITFCFLIFIICTLGFLC